ncbi:hypothetical protein niasHS_013829 [Heterodera schachtii]|uniref:Snurportin-1 n=1 Tax=Heterodera schachtii TaxID=97005 RepID=A0ABD2ILY3_HETSC
MDVDDLLDSFSKSTVTADNEFGLTSATTVGAEDGIGAQQQQQWEAAQHPHFGRNYKNEGRVAALQRQRRQEHLDRQHLAREDWLRRRREIEDDDSSFLRRMRRKTQNPYKDMLMFSDWLVDIPGTLSTEWTMLPSPVGRRTLVVANRGETRVYFKNGHLATNFNSLLPGGNAKTKGFFAFVYFSHFAFFFGSLTILDAIFDAKKRKLYLLDLLWWNKLMYTDMEFTARRFFLQSRIDEMNEDIERKNNRASISKNQERNGCKIAEQDKMSSSEISPYEMSPPSDTSPEQNAVEPKTRRDMKFVPVPSCACSPDEIGQFMRTLFPFRLDGLLFYYNSAFYIPEQTPLVGWLKPWMLPEVLGVPVPELYKEEMVCGGSQEFIDQFNKEHGHVSSAEKYRQKAQSPDMTMDEANANADEWAEGKEMGTAWKEEGGEQSKNGG